MVGKTPRTSGIRDKYDRLILAIQRGDEYTDSEPDMVFNAGDRVWLVGDPKTLETLR